jgi:hypothetical protein
VVQGAEYGVMYVQELVGYSNEEGGKGGVGDER